MGFYTSEYFAEWDSSSRKFGELDADVPQTIAFNNGSQCGYCTTGFVCNLAAYCANTKKEEREAIDIENIFDSNLCRCTGFRPILFGAKTLDKDNNKLEQENTPPLVVGNNNYYNGGLSNRNVVVHREDEGEPQPP